MTNFEKIKAMSVKEMASFLSEELNLVCDSCPVINTCTTNDNGCRANLQRWLESEVEE